MSPRACIRHAMRPIGAGQRRAGADHAPVPAAIASARPRPPGPRTAARRPARACRQRVECGHRAWPRSARRSRRAASRRRQAGREKAAAKTSPREASSHTAPALRRPGRWSKRRHASAAQRRDAGGGPVERQRESLDRRQADAQAGEAARSGGHGDQVERGGREPGRGEHRGEVVPAAARRGGAPGRRARSTTTTSSRSSATLPARASSRAPAATCVSRVAASRLYSTSPRAGLVPAAVPRQPRPSCPAPLIPRRPLPAPGASTTPAMRQYSRGQAAVSAGARVLPDGRLLRALLRGRAGGRARARSHADVAFEGRRLAPPCRCAACRFHAADGYIAGSSSRATAWPSASRSRIRRRPRAW